MANHQSAKKRNRQNIKRNTRNRAHRTQVKTLTRKVLTAVEENNQEEAEQSLKEASRVISKVASKGVLHSRTASRKISGLAKKVHQMSAAG
ncbi:MAG: 30S ribosomal protein S20 [Nitrospinaceae bacterium]|nr:30S ribosomal protein S20 [Nitrospinaceae bacterium]NIR54518.1 30S ribosomal protein S20 [Nitrospinaceae bacterium]NIS84937.1 30S ribosomal protein S20 [Nitrospinaceae bacterium]NIT81751.1 30S ribosomal protein S20 [Nitrospinaceae bacterium]NIU44020.1 30S ribosomal protein S20 [Nitrospinaceae bacterium]